MTHLTEQTPPTPVLDSWVGWGGVGLWLGAHNTSSLIPVGEHPCSASNRPKEQPHHNKHTHSECVGQSSINPFSRTVEYSIILDHRQSTDTH